MVGKIMTMEDQIHEWSMELFQICDRVIREADGCRVRFTLTTSLECYCRVRIAEDDESLISDENVYELSPNPRKWRTTVTSYQLCKRRLLRILKEKAPGQEDLSQGKG